jgi:hypothetical protein
MENLFFTILCQSNLIQVRESRAMYTGKSCG